MEKISIYALHKALLAVFQPISTIFLEIVGIFSPNTGVWASFMKNIFRIFFEAFSRRKCSFNTEMSVLIALAHFLCIFAYKSSQELINAATSGISQAKAWVKRDEHLFSGNIFRKYFSEHFSTQKCSFN